MSSSASNSVVDNDQNVVCGHRSNLSIEHLRRTREKLQLDLLGYEKEYELCDATCKAIRERYERKKEELRRSEFLGDESLLLRSPLDQLTLDCWKAFEFLGQSQSDLSNRSEEVIEPPPRLRPRLSPYPGHMETNERVACRKHATSSVAPCSASREGPASAYFSFKGLCYGPTSPTTMAQDGSRSTSIAHSDTSQGSISFEERRSASPDIIRAFSSGATTLVGRNTARQSVSVPGPSEEPRPHLTTHRSIISARTTNTAPQNKQPIEALFPRPLPRTYLSITFHARLLASKIWESPKQRQKPGVFAALKPSYIEKRLELGIKKKDVAHHRQMLLTDIKRLTGLVETSKDSCRALWIVWLGVKSMGERELGAGWDEGLDEVVLGGFGIEERVEADHVDAEKKKKKERGRVLGLDLYELIRSRRLRDRVEALLSKM